MNTDESIKRGLLLLEAYGGSWDEIRKASIRQSDGTLLVSSHPHKTIALKQKIEK